MSINQTLAIIIYIGGKVLWLVIGFGIGYAVGKSKRKVKG